MTRLVTLLTITVLLTLCGIGFARRNKINSDVKVALRMNLTSGILMADIKQDEIIKTGTTIYGNSIAGHKEIVKTGTTIYGNNIAGHKEIVKTGTTIYGNNIAGHKEIVKTGTNIYGNNISGHKEIVKTGTTIYGNYYTKQGSQHTS